MDAAPCSSGKPPNGPNPNGIAYISPAVATKELPWDHAPNNPFPAAHLLSPTSFTPPCVADEHKIPNDRKSNFKIQKCQSTIGYQLSS
jgi:hypothetical protein